MEIAHSTVIGKDGQPEAALVPWDVFQQMQELLSEKKPNAKTLEALEEPREGLTRFDSIADLMADLNS